MAAGILIASSATGLSAQSSALRELIVKNHLVFTPPGSAPFPTVVAIPGCSGVAFSDADTEANHPALREDDRLFRRHYPRAADRLAKEGFAVLLIDVHGAEDLVTACGGEIPSERIAQYIDAAVAWAGDLDFVDRHRIHVIGWSMGGGGVLAWLRGLRAQSETVRSAIAVYPDCSIREPLTSRVPLLMLLGGADDIAVPSECEDIVDATGARARISVRRYPGARHGYDIPDAPPVLDIGGGMSIGFQRAAAEATWLEIVEFLASPFRVETRYWLESGPTPAELEATVQLVRVSVARSFGEGVLEDGFPKDCTVVEPEIRTAPFQPNCVPGGPTPDGLLLDSSGRFLQFIGIDYLSARAFLFEVYLIPDAETAASLTPEARLEYPHVAIPHLELPESAYREWLSAMAGGIRAAGGQPFQTVAGGPRR